MTDSIEEGAGGIRAGAVIVLTLREPREKLWGVLDRIDTAGVHLRGVDLNSFEELMRAAAQNEPVFGVGEMFFPLWRVERMARDSRSGTIPALAEQFAARTGRSAAEIFAHDFATDSDESDAIS